MTIGRNGMRNGREMEQAQQEDATRQSGGAGGVPEAAGSWKIEFAIDDTGEWEGDPCRSDEALTSARDLGLRWSAIRDWRVVESRDPVNQPRRRADRSG
jgi:hypothetical protein